MASVNVKLGGEQIAPWARRQRRGMEINGSSLSPHPPPSYDHRDNCQYHNCEADESVFEHRSTHPRWVTHPPQARSPLPEKEVITSEFIKKHLPTYKLASDLQPIWPTIQSHVLIKDDISTLRPRSIFHVSCVKNI